MFRMGSVLVYDLIWMNLCTNSGLWLVTGLVSIYGVSGDGYGSIPKAEGSVWL